MLFSFFFNFKVFFFFYTLFVVLVEFLRFLLLNNLGKQSTPNLGICVFYVFFFFLFIFVLVCLYVVIFVFVFFSLCFIWLTQIENSENLVNSVGENNWSRFSKMSISKTKMPSAINEHHILGYMEWAQCDTWHSRCYVQFHNMLIWSIKRD